MATMEELSKLAKKIMSASVDAQFLELLHVSLCLGMAFEDVVRAAADLNIAAAKAEERQSLVDAGEDVGGS